MSSPYSFGFSLDDLRLVLVVDGMGGHKAGERASGIVAQAITERAAPSVTEHDIRRLLKEINQEVFAIAATNQQLLGMGATVAGLLLKPDYLIWFNVGDSRIYRHRENFLRQLSTDDVPSPAGMLVTKNIITQAIGGALQFVDIDPHVGVEPLVPGWRYLLCTDGITEVLGADILANAMRMDDAEAADYLLNQALASGAPDNISAILLTIDAEGPVRDGA